MYKYLFIALFVIPLNVFPQKGLHSIGKDQKLYELSVVWKELSYNFANMDNCRGLNMDSLYRAYIPIVQNTKNDFEYYKSLQQFLAHFHNGHTYASMPQYLNDLLSYPLLVTSYRQGKIIIDNIGSHYSKKICLGDEILKIDGIPALEYVKKNGLAYESMSNMDTTTMECAMFDPRLREISYAPKSYNKKLFLEIKTLNGLVNVHIPYDVDIKASPCDTAKQNRLHYIKDRNSVTTQSNLFLGDGEHQFAYLRLTRCDNEADEFFEHHKDTIRKYNNLILDVFDNGGGNGNAILETVSFLVNKDSIQWNTFHTRVNNSFYRAKASSRFYYYKAKDVSQKDKDLYYPYFFNTAFKDIPFSKFENSVPLAEQYKGNIYVITGHNTASAAESLVVALAQNPKMTIVGKKTAGANAQPLVIRLPSGIEVLINTSKTFDYKGKDISSGITPDYEHNFSEIYKTGQPTDWFKNIYQHLKILTGH